MVNKILRMPEVKIRTGLSRSTIYLRIVEGKFPSAIPLGGRAVGWLESELDDWLIEQIKNRREVKFGGDA